MPANSRLEGLFSFRGALAGGALCVLAALAAGGPKAAAGMALALLSVSLNIVVLARITGFFALRAQVRRPLGLAVLLVVGLFVKLPLFVFFVFLVYRMGGSALSGFAAGILLVYCALVGWSLLRGGS